MDPVTTAIVSAVVSGLVSSLATLAAIRVELKWLRRDVDYLMGRTAYLPHNPQN